MRSRNIKPGLFENEAIGSLPYETRLLFIGLWCISDREGRFEWRPKRIKALIFPYDDIDVTCHLMSLHAMTLILQYKVENVVYGFVPKFKKHQKPHPHEARSILPDPNDGEIVYFEASENNEQNQCHNMSLNVTKCKADILIPDIMIADSKYISPEKFQEDTDSKKDILDFVSGFQKAVMQSHGSRAPKITDSLISSGVATIDKLTRLDGFSEQEVFEAIRWAYSDSFWSLQVFSLASLRVKGKNGMTKFQNIINSMQNKQKTTGSARTDGNIRTTLSWAERKKKELENGYK